MMIELTTWTKQPMLNKTVSGKVKVGLLELQAHWDKGRADNKPILLFMSNIWQWKIYMFCTGYYNKDWSYANILKQRT